MSSLSDRFIAYLEKEDRENAFKLCMDALEAGEISIPDLYETVLAPALNRAAAITDRADEAIWQEHVMSSIVRGIVESAYPYVMKERASGQLACDERVLVFCPPGEDHEIGARMAADFFLIWGYKATFIGANTPEKTLMNAIERVAPRYLCISVSNDFNLFAAKRLIAGLRARFGSGMTILVGGRAFERDDRTWSEIGADRRLIRFTDIGTLRSGTEGRP